MKITKGDIKETLTGMMNVLAEEGERAFNEVIDKICNKEPLTPQDRLYIKGETYKELAATLIKVKKEKGPDAAYILAMKFTEIKNLKFKQHLTKNETRTR